jgi:3-methyladenine DNA glycosylase/8-oxoguanine DNA glycosylase
MISASLDLEAIELRQNTDRVIRELDKILCIGVWTAEFTVLGSMSRWGAMPAR